LNWRGASVVVADVATEGGQETVDLIEDDGGEATFVEADVSALDSVQELIDAAVERDGRLDVTHTYAGIIPSVEYVTTLYEAG